MLIVLPKGRLLKEIKNLLELIGISFEDSTRKLVMDTFFERYQSSNP
jgi:ATP phosphoribosyltransferase